MSLSNTAVDCSVSPAWQPRDQSQAASSSLDCGFLDCQINRRSWCYLEEPTYVGNELEEETLLDRMSTRYGFSSLRSVRKTSMLFHACIGLMQEFGARNILQVVEDEASLLFNVSQVVSRGFLSQKTPSGARILQFLTLKGDFSSRD